MKRKGLAEDIHEIGATNSGDLKQTEIMFPRFYAKNLISPILQYYKGRINKQEMRGFL
jgi:hypothetical protein